MKQFFIIVALLAIGAYCHEHTTEQSTPASSSCPACPACTYNIAQFSGVNSGYNVNLTGVTVFMTGGSRGMGRATSLFYASLGATVYSCARTPFGQVRDKSELKSAGINYRRCDVRNRESFADIVDEFENEGIKIDLLVNFAGIMFFGFPNDITDAQHLNLVKTNVIGFTNVWNTFKRFMNPNPATVRFGDVSLVLNSTVVVISSSTADFLSPFLAHYSGSKIDLDRNAQVTAWSNRNKPFRFIIMLPALTQTTVMENSMLWERTESPFCSHKVAWNYNATIKRMNDMGQSPLVVSQSILRRYIEMPWGTIGRFSASTAAGYGEYAYLAAINSKNQPDAAIKEYHGLFAPPRVEGSPGADPVC